MKEKTNYFVFPPGWISNFGVDPWLLLRAFLFAPIFVFLFFLIAFVCFVFEDISISYFIQSLKRTFLSSFSAKVKIICLFSTFPAMLIASSPISSYKVLSVGEQLTLALPPGARYSIGNKQILSAKPTDNQLLIKAKKSGFSDIVIWKHQQKHITHINSLASYKHRKKLGLIHYLNRKDIPYRLSEKKIYLLQTINNWEDYSHLIEWCVKEGQSQCDGDLSQQLSWNIIMNTYKVFTDHHYPYISCTPLKLLVHCKLYGGQVLFKDQYQLLKRNKGLFFTNQGTSNQSNFRVSFKVFQMDSATSHISNLGFDHLSQAVAPFFNQEAINPFQTNTLRLQNNRYKFTLLAEPEILTNLKIENEIKLGQDQPYQTSATNQSSGQVQQILWRFIGLKINFKLLQKSGQYFLDYKTSFSSGGSTGEPSSIKGNSEKSVIRITPGKVINFFKIGLQQSTTSDGAIPFFSKIPVLGALFKSHQKNYSYRHLIGYLYIDQPGDTL